MSQQERRISWSLRVAKPVCRSWPLPWVIRGGVAHLIQRVREEVGESKVG